MKYLVLQRIYLNLETKKKKSKTKQNKTGKYTEQVNIFFCKIWVTLRNYCKLAN